MDSNWYQQALTPPQVIEGRLRVGLIPDQDHAQVQVDVFDPTTGVLLAQWSSPHFGLHQLPERLSRACQELQTLLDRVAEPF